MYGVTPVGLDANDEMPGVAYNLSSSDLFAAMNWERLIASPSVQ